ncbi:shikimate dehydrogenase [Alteromonas lipotrueiana]|uniref:shikimate dehydrogenase n=1 Tax=Alteromonas lipotrueiana TaxID=2803815 RepID=UPI001C461FC4|nr:shikimate dehydrogenase [Alteromonas lipotrueiana]
MNKFAVFGNPIAHSLSPTIHQMFAEQCGITISYEKKCAPLDNFDGCLERFFSDSQAIGCNITVPFKGDAVRFADKLDDAAALAQAVNTLHRQGDNSFRGYNTDGLGLVADLNNQGVELKNKSVLLIGAGGAARGVVNPLLDAGLKKLSITNRTIEKAQKIVAAVDDNRFGVLDRAALDGYKADIIINTTSASLTNELPEVTDIIFDQSELAYDMVYAAQPTVFMKYARQQGTLHTADGLGMLVEQAAAAFTIWTSMHPKSGPVIETLRKQLE